jgi:EAL domain-containing protein (putative c-di-GMP-specific phosphodiesterase class I)
MSLLNLMQSALTRYQIEPGMIEIEITENSLARDKEKFLATLGQIKDMGVKISIDDFGSGYSNMECLKSMVFSSLKIDKSFIDNVGRQKSDRAIYRAMISMAHNLNLTVVAEGVETQQQLMFLKSINCDLIQGYYYSKPLPAPQFAEYCVQMLDAIPTLEPIFIPTQENHKTASH